jgi:hypothetical protein
MNPRTLNDSVDPGNGCDQSGNGCDQSGYTTDVRETLGARKQDLVELSFRSLEERGLHAVPVMVKEEARIDLIAYDYRPGSRSVLASVASRPERFRAIAEMLDNPLARKLIVKGPYIGEIHSWVIVDGCPRVEITVIGPEAYTAPLPLSMQLLLQPSP